MVNEDSFFKYGSYEYEDEEEERMKSGGRSGGSGDSRLRKILLMDFRNGSFVSIIYIYKIFMVNWCYYKVYFECVENCFILIF